MRRARIPARRAPSSGSSACSLAPGHPVRPGRPGHGPGLDARREPAPHPPGDDERGTRSWTTSSCSSRTATGWPASSPTSSGSSAGCTTSRRPGCSSSTTPTCRSTSRRTGGRRPSSRSGTRRARSSGSGWTRRRRWPSRSGRSCIATTTRSSSVASGRARPYAAALRTPIERVLALGSPRTDFFFDEAALAAARERVLAAHPEPRRAAGRPLRPDVPRPRHRQAGGHRARCRRAAGRPARRTTRWSSRPTRTSIRPTTPTAGFDLVADPTGDDQRPAGR